jgi:gamma-glutamyltranspeptidase
MNGSATVGSEGLGPGLGHARPRHPHRPRCPAPVWGWEEVAPPLRHDDVQETLQPADRLREQGFPVSERIAFDWTLPNASARWPATRAAAAAARDPGRRCHVVT